MFLREYKRHKLMTLLGWPNLQMLWGAVMELIVDDVNMAQDATQIQPAVDRIV